MVQYSKIRACVHRDASEKVFCFRSFSSIKPFLQSGYKNFVKQLLLRVSHLLDSSCLYMPRRNQNLDLQRLVDLASQASKAPEKRPFGKRQLSRPPHFKTLETLSSLNLYTTYEIPMPKSTIYTVKIEMD